MHAFRSTRTRRASSLVLFAALAQTACVVPTEAPTFPAGAVEYQAPPVYRLWWNLVESCSGLSGDFSAVRFYDEPGVTIATAGADSANGYWFGDGNRILVGQERMYEGPLLRHEMLHALLGRAEGSGHPRQYFIDRCGGVVHCQGACLTNDPAPPAPDPSAPQVQPSDMRMDVRVDPSPFDSTTYDGWAAITVTVTNPFSHTVWVDAPISALGYTLANGLTQETPLFESPLPFTSGEVRRQVFDVQFDGGAMRLAPGSYALRAIFAGDTGSAVTLQVR